MAMPTIMTASYSICELHPLKAASFVLVAGRGFTMRSGESPQSLQKLGDLYQKIFCSFVFYHSVFQVGSRAG